MLCAYHPWAIAHRIGLMARRLAAILAADVVGYSRLMAADEKGTHALKALRQDFIEPKIAEHHGRVAKLMGDGALVEFASVVDVVECAAAIQKGVAELQADLPEGQRIAFRYAASWKMMPRVWRAPERTRLTPWRIARR
jgi:class 3 adenylate cyclase